MRVNIHLFVDNSFHHSYKMSSYANYSCKKRTIQQLPTPARKGHNAILNAEYIQDIIEIIGTWSCQRIFLVHSKALDHNTDVIKKLKEKLGSFVVGAKSGVGAHSPYEDILDIAKMIHEKNVDCLISIGSSSYSDASKIARLMHTNLAPDNLTVEAMEALVNQDKGCADNLKDPKVKLILVPTSLSASEWNNNSSATNPHTHKKQHFASEQAAPDLILLDREVASTSPRTLWLASGMRAVDHCVETMVNEKCPEEAFRHMEDALAVLLRGLKDYKNGENEGNRDELLDGIGDCQIGSRNAMMGLLLWNVRMGLSHTIGHQLGSVCDVMHGVTSCIMLAPVLRYTASKSDRQKQIQERVLGIWNKVLKSEEPSLADAVSNFVKYLELPSTLKEVGVEEQEVIDKVAEQTLTDVMWEMEAMGGKEDVLAILDTAKVTHLHFGRYIALSSPMGKFSELATSSTITWANSAGSCPSPHRLIVLHISYILLLSSRNFLERRNHPASSHSAFPSQPQCFSSSSPHNGNSSWPLESANLIGSEASSHGATLENDDVEVCDCAVGDFVGSGGSHWSTQILSRASSRV
ncbi:maleylacetate reductase [Pyrenophora seminiperda CCB06]|uniref:Maleylacetate reductase n=1 Tax=Pyrenophora seminiperda CCB06 TaxID=1302712 RepID=A0A3M7M9N1_9PLEO|nr:maleylacetate reductase [Pyrenophora seminiperda CCB06]